MSYNSRTCLRSTPLCGCAPGCGRRRLPGEPHPTDYQFPGTGRGQHSIAPRNRGDAFQPRAPLMRFRSVLRGPLSTPPSTCTVISSSIGSQSGRPARSRTESTINSTWPRWPRKRRNHTASSIRRSTNRSTGSVTPITTQSATPHSLVPARADRGSGRTRTYKLTKVLAAAPFGPQSFISSTSPLCRHTCDWFPEGTSPGLLSGGRS